MDLLITYFFKYLLAPLLVVMILFIMNGVKTIKKQLNVKYIIIYVLIAGAILGLPGVIAMLKDEYVWGGIVLVVGFYIIAGLLFLYTMNNNIANVIGVKDNIWSQILLMITTGILGGWIHYLLFDWLGGMPYGTWAMTLVIWYMIPFMTALSLDCFHQVPPPLYELWYVGQSSFNRNYWDNVDNFQAIPVRVKLKRRMGDKDYSAFTVRLHDGIILGEWFDWLVEDQNKRSPAYKIDTNVNNDRIGWIFYTSRWINYPLFIRILNPKEDRIANKLRRNQTIYIKRVSVQESKQHEED